MAQHWREISSFQDFGMKSAEHFFNLDFTRNLPNQKMSFFLLLEKNVRHMILKTSTWRQHWQFESSNELALQLTKLNFNHVWFEIYLQYRTMKIVINSFLKFTKNQQNFNFGSIQSFSFSDRRICTLLLSFQSNALTYNFIVRTIYFRFLRISIICFHSH